MYCNTNENYGTFNRKHRVSYFDLSYVLLGHNDKGQTISKANYAIFLQNEHRLSFCINLEVVILEVEIQRSFFGRIHDNIDCFRDLLTFSVERGLTVFLFCN